MRPGDEQVIEHAEADTVHELIDRREFMKLSGVAGVGLLGVPALLAACGSSSTASSQSALDRAR